MANLKALKSRIKSVKSTQKITKAMKMVAASRLKRAQTMAENTRPYSEKMAAALTSLAASFTESDGAPLLLTGRKEGKKHLLIVMASDRGLCGAFNSSVTKAARLKVRELEAQGKEVKVLTIGTKAYDLLRPFCGPKIIRKLDAASKKKITFEDAEKISHDVIDMFEAGDFDSFSVYYNKFKSAISQVTTHQSLVPLELPKAETAQATTSTTYEYEPGEAEILADLLPRNIAVQIYHGLLESSASEQAARMTAMDNATRNAGEMIKKLTLVYNRTRQAAITKELIEIISGAEAV